MSLLEGGLSLGLWQDSPNVGQRANELMRENWLILDECARLCDAGELDDLDGIEEFGDLLGRSLVIEGKCAQVRVAEFAETQRRWYVEAFGADYEGVLGWDQTSSSRLRRIL